MGRSLAAIVGWQKDEIGINLISLNRQPIDVRLNGIIHSMERIYWLSPFITNTPNIIHLGCSNGTETIGTAWKFNATNIIGLDNNQDDINDANKLLFNLRKDIQAITRKIQCYSKDIDDDDIEWWNNSVPCFIKRNLLMEDIYKIRFVVQDITKPINLIANSYDLVLADFVLNHIWLGEGGPKESNNISFVIAEVNRLLKNGGKIAVYEPMRGNEKPLLDYRIFFTKIGLIQLHYREINRNNSTICEILYMKPEKN